MDPALTPAEIENLRERARASYRQSGSVDETAVELGLSLAGTRSLLDLADEPPTASGWRIDLPPIGPPGIRRT